MFQPRCGILRLAWGERPGVAFHFFLGACLSGGRVGFFRPASVFRKRPITFHLRVVLLRPVGGDRQSVNASLQLSATDVSAQTTMKGAAKCDKHCDLQNSVNQQELERILRFRDTPESMPASVSTLFSCRCSASPSRVVAQALPAVRVCASGVPRLCWQQPLMCEVCVWPPWQATC